MLGSCDFATARCGQRLTRVKPPLTTCAPCAPVCTAPKTEVGKRGYTPEGFPLMERTPPAHIRKMEKKFPLMGTGRPKQA